MKRFPPACVAGLLLGLAPAAVSAQLRADDAGDTTQTAGRLHVGVNRGFSDYLLPRRTDVDVWGLTTEPGRVYRISAVPIDEPWEIYSIDGSLYPAAGPWGLVQLGYLPDPLWVTGAGGVEYLTIRGVGRASGEPRQYEIVVEAQGGADDPEPDTDSDGVLLTDGVWYDGTLLPDRRFPDRIAADVDCFRFRCAEGGIYRLEYRLASGASPDPYTQPSIYGQTRSVADSPDHPAGSACLVNLPGGDLKAAVDCTLFVRLQWNQRYGPAQRYKVRVTRVGSTPPDDHANTSGRATVLAPPPLGSASATGAIGGPEAFQPYPVGGSARGDIDWFAVQLPPGRACTVTVTGAGLYPYPPQNLTNPDTGGLRVVGEAAEWGELGSCEAALWSGAMAVPVKTMRFHSRQNGRPVRFGLTGTLGTYQVTATDLGPAVDAIGDPLTRGQLVVRVGHPQLGALEYPTDIDSVLIERPATPGLYYLRCQYTVPNTPNPVIFPGFSLVRPAAPGQYSRTTRFHVQDETILLTSLGGAGADSFPARIDLLNKRYPDGPFPATGPVHTYAVSLTYAAPVSTSLRIGPSDDDEAPASLAGAPMVTVGTPFQARRHLGGDRADVFGVQLLAGRTYRYPVGGYWARLSVLDPSGAELVDGDAVPIVGADSEAFERSFVAPASGVYGLKISYRDSDNFTASATSWISDDGISGDTPQAAGPAKLREGQNTDTINYRGDRDTVELPYEPGVAFRIRVTGDAGVTVARSDYSPFEPVTSEPLLYAYVPLGGPRAPTRFTLRGAVAGQHYSLAVERIGQLHPSEAAADVPSGWPVLDVGGQVTLADGAPLVAERFGVRVQAGRWYRIALRTAFLDQPVAQSFSYASFVDDQGLLVNQSQLTAPFFAHRSGVMWVQPDYAPPWPWRATLLDEGPGSDEAGAVPELAGRVRLEDVIDATIDRPGDLDLWRTQGLERPGYEIVILDVKGHELSRSGIRAEGGEVSWTIGDGIVPAGAAYPFPYRVMIQQRPVPPTYTPVPLCLGDIATTAGRSGRDGVRDNNDLVAFINAYIANSRTADIASAGAALGADGWLDNNDFVVMLDLLFTPCP